MQFIDYCDEHNILLAILPPHSTHRLQFLDVSVFSLLEGDGEMEQAATSA